MLPESGRSQRSNCPSMDLRTWSRRKGGQDQGSSAGSELSELEPRVDLIGGDWEGSHLRHPSPWVDFGGRSVYNSDIMTVRENIAKNIRTLRKAAGLTQKELAAKLKLCRPAISEMEAAKRGVGVEECIEIAEIFGVLPERVYGSNEGVCAACGQVTRNGRRHQSPPAYPGDQT